MNVFLIAALTVDGFVGKTPVHRSSDWTSPEDLKYYISRLKAADAIIVGSRTFQTFHRYPKGSNWYIYTREPEKFTNPSPSVISAQGTNEPPQTLIDRLKAEGKQNVAITGGASIYTLFLNAGVLTKLYLTIEPYIFGTGVKLFTNDVQTKLSLDKVQKLNPNTLVLEYTVAV